MPNKKTTVAFSGTEEQEEALRKVIEEMKEEKGVTQDVDLTAEDLKKKAL